MVKCLFFDRTLFDLLQIYKIFIKYTRFFIKYLVFMVTFKSVKVNQSHYKPGVAQRVSGS